MKKKLLVGILVLTMLAACLGVSAFAAAASSDITTADALAAALGGTNVEGVITINDDNKEIATRLTIDGVTATIDLNGKTITTKDKSGLFYLKNNANITITDSSGSGSVGSLTNTAEFENTLTHAKFSYNEIITGVDYTLTLKNGVKLAGGTENSLGSATSKIIEGYNAKIYIDKAELVAEKGGYVVALQLKENVLNIKDGTFTGGFSGTPGGGSVTGGTYKVSSWPVTLQSILADGYTVQNIEGGFTVVEGDPDTAEASLVNSGKTVYGKLDDLVKNYPSKEITVIKNALTLTLNEFGSEQPNSYSALNTINLVLGEKVEKLTISGTVKVAKIVITGDESKVDHANLKVTNENKYKTLEDPKDAGKVTLMTDVKTIEESYVALVTTEQSDGTTKEVYYTVDGLRGVKANLKSIKILQDFTMQTESEIPFGIIIPDGTDVTIDLNGKTVTYSGDIAAVISQQGSKVTITDTSEDKAGVIKATSGLVLALGSSENDTTYGEAVVDTNATLEGMVGIYNNSTLTVKGTINGGESHAISSWEGPAPEEGEEKVSHDGTVVIVENGGKVLSSGNAAIYMPQNGTVTVKEGGLVQGKTGILARDGEIVVDGGTVEATGEDNEPAIKVEKKDGYGDEDRPTASVEVKSGEVKSASGETLAYEDKTVGDGELTDEQKAEIEAAAKEQIKVEGGTFTTGSDEDVKGDTSANKYVPADKDVNPKTGFVRNFSAEIQDFGYAADRITALDTAAKVRTDWKTSGYWDPEGHTGTADWVGQTMWVTFDEPLPVDKTVTITVTPPADGGEPFDVDCVGNGTGRTFAWSFLNPEQVPNNAVVSGTYTISDKSGKVSIDQDTVDVPVLDEKTVQFAVLGDPVKEGNEGFDVTVKSNSSVGQYYDVVISTQDLPISTGSGSVGTKYWVGWAIAAPKTATQYSRINADTYEELLEAAKTSKGNKTDLEAKVVGDDSGYSIYYDAATGEGDWRMITFWGKRTEGEEEKDTIISTVIVHTSFDGVTFKAPEVSDPVAANVKDNYAASDVYGTYTVTPTRGEADPYTTVTINASAVKPHYNAQGKLGYWVGFALEAPANATYFKWGTNSDLSKLTVGEQVSPVEEDVYTGAPKEGVEYPTDGVAFYFDANDPANNNLYYVVEWYDDDAGQTLNTKVIYKVTFDVETANPEAPVIYTAITGKDPTNDPNGEQEKINDLQLVKDATYGYVWEVTLNPGKLFETESSKADQEKAYYTGIALPAPAGAKSAKYAFPEAGGNIDISDLQDLDPLEKEVYGEQSGIAFYVEVTKADLSLNKEWAAVQWIGEDGKVLDTYIIHIVLGEDVQLQIEGLEIQNQDVTAGFKVDKEAAKTALETAITTAGGSVTIDDASGNMIYVAFKGTVEGSDKTITVEIKKDGEAIFNTTADTSTLSTTKGYGYFYYSFDVTGQLQSGKALEAGEYTINLKNEGTVVASVTVTINKVTYATGTGVTVPEGTALPEDYFVDAADLATSPLGTVDIPTGATCADGSHLEWVVGEPDEDGVITVTLTAVANRPVSGGGASATTSKVTTPENGSVELSSTTARGGQTVTVTATPDEGYDVGEVIVKDRNGNPVEVTKNDDGTYSYTVPAGKTPVTVEVIFDECLCDDFADLDLDEWYHEAVDYAIKSELMLGQGDGWHPTDAVRGAEIFVILGRLDGAGLETGGDHWYDESLAWAMEKGYTDGSTPLANCSRERAVTLLWRYYGEQASDADITGFVDAADVSDWALDAMKWAVENEIIKGLDNNDIQPKKDLTRAEFATILERLEAAPATETAE